MSSHRTVEQAKQNYIDLMGENLGREFHALWQEVARLYGNWGQYVELYGTKRSRVDLLNKTAPFFFRIVQDALLEQTILHVARLTDPPKSGGRANLTIRRLPGLIEDTRLAGKVEGLVLKARQSCEFCRDWRNRRLAHNDLVLITEIEVEPLKGASRDGVEASLGAIANVLNAVTGHYMQSESFFESFDRESAVQLLYVLDDGLKEKRKRMRRLVSADTNCDDFGHRNL